MIRSARRLVKKGASIVIGRTEEFYSLQRIWKKDVKKCWQKAGDVVLYLSAKGRRKEWLLKAAEAKRKNQYGCVEKRATSSKRLKSFWKKYLTKNHFCGKIIKSSAAKTEAHRTLKIEQYRKTCNGTYFRVGKTRKTIPNKVIHTGRKRLRAERRRFNTF